SPTHRATRFTSRTRVSMLTDSGKRCGKPVSHMACALPGRYTSVESKLGFCRMTPIWISIPTHLKWPSTIPGLTKSIRKLPLLANQHYRRSVIGELNVSSWALRLPGHRWDHITVVECQMSSRSATTATRSDSSVRPPTHHD